MNIAQLIHDWGVRNNHDCGCYKTGMVRQGEKIVGHYAACRSIPNGLIAAIPGSRRMVVSPKYAPEIRSFSIFVPVKETQ